MRRAGSESWRFAHDIPQTLHVLLYIRDALGLQVEQGPGIPPRLAGGVPDRSELLDPAARSKASRDWPEWWAMAVATALSTEIGPQGVSTGEWRRSVGERQRLVADPPEWSFLSDRPALQAAARALYEEGGRWFSPARQSYLSAALRDVFAWEQVRDAAEATATEHQVSPGTINGCVLVLLVEGNWWELAGSGAALCSVSAATNPEATQTILHQVFESQLAA
jgi:hypothetical protein